MAFPWNDGIKCYEPHNFESMYTHSMYVHHGLFYRPSISWLIVIFSTNAKLRTKHWYSTISSSALFELCIFAWNNKIKGFCGFVLVYLGCLQDVPRFRIMMAARHKVECRKPL